MAQDNCHSMACFVVYSWYLYCMHFTIRNNIMRFERMEYNTNKLILLRYISQTKCYNAYSLSIADLSKPHYHSKICQWNKTGEIEMNNNALHARGNLCFLGNCKLLDTFSYFDEVDISFPSNKLVTWKPYKISNHSIL